MQNLLLSEMHWEMSPTKQDPFSSGGHLNVKMMSYHYINPIMKERWSHDPLIFIMGIYIPGKMVFILRQGPDLNMHGKVWYWSITSPDMGCLLDEVWSGWLFSSLGWLK